MSKRSRARPSNPGDAYGGRRWEISLSIRSYRENRSFGKNIKLSESGHRIVSRGGEHALEVQLPFLKTILGISN